MLAGGNRMSVSGKGGVIATGRLCSEPALLAVIKRHLGSFAADEPPLLTRAIRSIDLGPFLPFA